MQKITPFLWYNGHVEEAVALYTSAFPNSKVLNASILPALLQDPDRAKAKRAMDAMLTMGKIDVAQLEHVAEG